ncbi:MAG TPA: type 1 glutamine amidotransferase [Gemmatimonadales bacterium]|nr:type 1 glutamine amidotransferase [Gemmatimonadales bacterium]
MAREPGFVVIQHAAGEGPGLIGLLARQRGLPLDLRRMDLGEALPDVSAVAALVVLGGPMGAYEALAHPHLLDEQRLLEEAVERGLPVLGICLGSQLLAAALGARVYPGPEPEIGVFEVKLTQDGADDPLLGPAGPKFSAFHWHGDTFELPPGAVHIASTRAYKHQAFRFGDRAWGLQFHIELDQALAREWAAVLPRGASPTEPQRAAIEKTGRGVLNRFFELARRRTQ